MNNFKVLVIAHDFAGFKKGEIYVCRDNEYYVSNSRHQASFHKDLLLIDNPNFDFTFFNKAEMIVKENLGITGDLYYVWVKMSKNHYNEYSVISCYVERIIDLYKELVG
jgi:hypothetical protein